MTKQRWGLLPGREAEAAARYRAGESLREIAASVNASVFIVRQCLVSQGVPIRSHAQAAQSRADRQRPAREEAVRQRRAAPKEPHARLRGREEEVLARYAAGVSAFRLGRELGVSPDQVRRLLLLRGVAVRGPGEAKKAGFAYRRGETPTAG